MSKTIRNRRTNTYTLSLSDIGEGKLNKYQNYFILAWNSDLVNDEAAFEKRYKDLEPIVVFKITSIDKDRYSREYFCVKAIYGRGENTYITELMSYMKRKWVVTNDKKLMKYMVEKQNLRKYTKV